MAAQHQSFRKALRASGVDVVLLEFLDERGSHHPCNDCRGAVAKRQCGEDEVPDGIAKGVEVKGQERIHRVETRRVVDGREDIRIASSDRKPA